MSKSIKIKQVAYGVSGILPEHCTLVVGNKWDSSNEMPPMYKRAKENKTNYLTSEKLSDILVLDQASDIVLFGASDWSEQLDELNEAIGIVSKLGKKVALQVPCTFEQFQFKLGVYVSKQQGDLYNEMKHMMDNMEDIQFFQMLGMAYLDNQLQYDYYVIAELGKPKHYFIRKDDGDEIS